MKRACKLIEDNADTILEEIGIDFLDDAEALEMWKAAGADVQGTRVRFPKGLCRSLIQATAPKEYVQHARNPQRSTMIGGKRTVLCPPTDHLLSMTLIRVGATPPLRTLIISSNSPTWRRECITLGAQSVSPWICR